VNDSAHRNFNLYEAEITSSRRWQRHMGKLTGTHYGDAANALFGFYGDKAHELEEAGQFYMSAVALAFALETGILTYLLVEFGEDNGGELEIPHTVNMANLIEACNEIDVLNAPIDIPSHVRQETKNGSEPSIDTSAFAGVRTVIS
jgi:hypothetical protein